MECEAGGWDKAFVLFITVDRLEPGKDSVKDLWEGKQAFCKNNHLNLNVQTMS